MNTQHDLQQLLHDIIMANQSESTEGANVEAINFYKLIKDSQVELHPM